MLALLVVADQYGLNPFTKEIYAFPDKQNGIVRVAGIDGWSRIINQHPQFDGMEFRASETFVGLPGAKPCPEWMECILYRKDRQHPGPIREYLDEVYREPYSGQKDGRPYALNGPWQTHTKRFLRHKTMIQAARLVFGFVGLYDVDEAERILEAQSETLGVTASDAPVLIGSPFKTVWRLWAEKRGLVPEADLSRNPHVQRGLREEPEARRRYEERHGELLLPLFAESSLEPILRASFDGLTEAGRPVELKAPTEANFRNAVAFGDQSVLYQRYYAQVQTQIFVADADAGVLSLHVGREFLDLDVPRDEACIGHIVEAAQVFWDRVRTGQEPPLDPERDLYRPAGTDLAVWQKAAGDYLRLERERQTLAARIKALDRALSELEPPLLALMGEFLLADAEGLRITRFLQQGAIDYKAALKALVPDLPDGDLNAYRRKAAERVRMTVRPEAGALEAPDALAAPIEEPQAAFVDGWF